MNPYAEAAMSSHPPQNLEAEQGVIGSIFLSEAAFDEVAEVLRTEHFFSETNRLIFEAIQAMFTRGVKPDAVTLSEELARSGKLDIVGGDEYLIQILEAVPNAAHARYYADIVRNRWMCRELALICGQTASQAVHENEETADLIAGAESQIHRLMESTVQSGPVDMSAGLDALEALRASGNCKGISTGFAGLDTAIGGGLKPGKLNVLGARTSVGKTAMANCIAHNVASQGNGVLIFSLEMSLEDIMRHLVTLESGLNFAELDDTSELDEMGRDRVVEAQNSVANLPISVHAKTDISLQKIAAISRLHKRRHDIQLCVIDYLQLVTPADRRVPREQQVAEMSRGLKALADGLDIPILLLAQLNRGIENRDDKRPRLADLRESGAIEQDADRVLFLYRESVYDPDADACEAELIIAKSRGCGLGTIPLHWTAPRLEFRDAIPV